MWMYPGPRCPDHPSSEELSTANVHSWIHKVLDLGVNPNPRAGPTPLHGGVASDRVSMLGPILAAFTILSFHCARDLMQGLGGGRSEPRDADPPEDAARREAKCASDGETRAQRERERTQCATGRVEKGCGVDTPPPLDLGPPTRGQRKGRRLCLPCLPDANPDF
jgi:hypothetical protein